MNNFVTVNSRACVTELRDNKPLRDRDQLDIMWIVPWKANRVLWWLSSAWVCVTFISYVTFCLQPQSTWVSWQLLRDTYQLRYTQFTATVWCWRHVHAIDWNYSSRSLMWLTYTTYWKSYKQMIVTQSRKKYKSLSLWEGQTWTDLAWDYQRLRLLSENAHEGIKTFNCESIKLHYLYI